MAEVNLKQFNLDYCKGFSADKLRKMYNGESKETLDALILALNPKASKVESEDAPKTENKKAKNN